MDQSIFAPSNFQEQAGTGTQEQAPNEVAPARGIEGYRNVFAPRNLENQAGAGDSNGETGDERD